MLHCRWRAEGIETQASTWAAIQLAAIGLLDGASQFGYRRGGGGVPPGG